MYDLVLKGGRIYDGSGMPSFNGDVAVKDGKIAEIGRLNGGAKRTLNVDGLAPAKPEDREALIKSFVRVEAISRRVLEEGVKWQWTSTAEYRSALGARLG